MGSINALPPVEPPKILFIDAFDSFSNNIVGMLQQCLCAEVVMVHIDDASVGCSLEKTLRAFDAVVVGPGPGHPANSEDVGFIDRLWGLSDVNIIPVLGICLGFQSLCLHHGAKVEKLQQPRHGIVSKPTYPNEDIFHSVKDLETTQYHSLRVTLGSPTWQDDTCWLPTEACPMLRPLAWDLSDNTNGPILMSVRHTERPFWGVQFHPESICTSQSGQDLLANWWRQAQQWSLLRQRVPTPGCKGPAEVNEVHLDEHTCSHFASQLRSIVGPKDPFLRWGKHTMAPITPTDLAEALGLDRDDMILLDSQGHSRGRFSILGLVTPGKTMTVTYKVSDKTLRYGLSSTQMHTVPVGSIEEVWPILQEALDFHDPRHATSSQVSTRGQGIEYTGLDKFVAGHLPEESPFWGGFMGYVTYEAGLETIDVNLHDSCSSDGIPDVNFAFIHRSIVIDHEKEQVFIQSLLPGDWPWVLNVGRTVDDMKSRAAVDNSGQSLNKPSLNVAEEVRLTHAVADADIRRPTEDAYRTKVLRCQEFLAAGDSYELCLTDETEIKIPEVNGLNPWALYKRLRSNNPAPYGAYLKLLDVTVVGSSPELFLKWDRGGRCQFRPIKGTVKKGPGITRERAHEILGSSKERAENLMIVDLIRHDLSGVVGADNTWVSELMVIEEYEAVYQLVSVIEGQQPPGNSGQSVPRGLDVLKASLPPGSMTGAPKKRSCEILRDIECRSRGIYSGVLGYMDVGGSGSFSVVIRTALRHDSPGEHDQPQVLLDANGYTHLNGLSAANERCNASNSDGGMGKYETWRVGAGGAVTIQSTDEGEFLEMEVKASSVLGALFSAASS